MQFTKPPKTLEDQISLLKKRGMKVMDERSATHTLSNISYYRLSAYFQPFQHFGDSDHIYKPGAEFRKAFNLYLFDRELRLVSMDAIERIEVSLRCKIIYEFSTRYGNNWYEDPDMYTSVNSYQRLMIKITEEVNRSKENFIVHYRRKYTSPQNPPAWMALEVLSFGQLSIMYKSLKANDAKKAVAEYFGISYTILISWMEHLGYIRNLCAHHSRLWNRTMTIKPTLPKKVKYPWIDTSCIRPDKVYISFSIMAFILQRITPHSYFTGKLRALLYKFKETDFRPAGFYKEWELDPFWNNMKIPFTYKVRILFFKYPRFRRILKIAA